MATNMVAINSHVIGDPAHTHRLCVRPPLPSATSPGPPRPICCHKSWAPTTDLLPQVLGPHDGSVDANQRETSMPMITQALHSIVCGAARLVCYIAARRVTITFTTGINLFDDPSSVEPRDLSALLLRMFKHTTLLQKLVRAELACDCLYTCRHTCLYIGLYTCRHTCRYK